MADENKDSSSESLDAVFSSEATPSESSPASEDNSTTSTDESADSKKEDSSSSEPGVEKLPGEKKDDTEGTDKPSKAEKTEEKPDDKVDEKKKDEKPAPVSEEVVTLQKRFDDAQRWGQEISQERSKLAQVVQQQAQALSILQKKVEGTWTDDDEAALNSGHTQVDVAERGVLYGKATASRAAAVRELGEAEVNTQLTEFHQLFGENDLVQQVVKQADSPVHEAMAIIERHRFQLEHGTTPKQWVESITKKVTKDLTKSIRASILEEIRNGKKAASETPTSLSDVSGESTSGTKLIDEPVPSLQSVFEN